MYNPDDNHVTQGDVDALGIKARPKVIEGSWPGFLKVLSNAIDTMPDGVLVAGGSCITLFNPYHQFSDYDIFVSSQEALDELKYFLQCEGFSLVHTVHDRTAKAVDVYLEEFSSGPTKVQVMRRFGQTPQEILATFDLRLCMVGFTKDSIYTPQGTEKDIHDRVLTVIRPATGRSRKATDTYFRALFDRIVKYSAKGYSLSVTGEFDFISQLMSYKIANDIITNSMDKPF